MAHNNIEIEIQVRVEHADPLRDFLEKNAEFKSEKRQVDEYFTPAHRNFLESRPVQEWLRLREEAGRESMNYKRWHLDEIGRSHYCDEYETAIENGEQVRKIFAALDIRSVARVDKVRKLWIYQDYEIALDSVRNLGDFVEIEYCGTDTQTDPKEITAGMIAFLKHIGVGTIERNYVGYPYLVLFPDEARSELQ